VLARVGPKVEVFSKPGPPEGGRYRVKGKGHWRTAIRSGIWFCIAFVAATFRWAPLTLFFWRVADAFTSPEPTLLIFRVAHPSVFEGRGFRCFSTGHHSELLLCNALRLINSSSDLLTSIRTAAFSSFVLTHFGISTNSAKN